MTQAEAEARRDIQNTEIGAGADIARMYVFKFWDLAAFEVLYDTVLLPYKYDVQILAATDSQLLAFKRVSNATFYTGGWTTLAQFEGVFDTEAAADTELAAYLGV